MSDGILCRGKNEKIYFRLSTGLLRQPFCADVAEARRISQADSPALQSCESYGICEGGEQDQYIIAELIFDRPVSFSEELKEQLRVVIGGQRIAPERESEVVRSGEPGGCRAAENGGTAG